MPAAPAALPALQAVASGAARAAAAPAPGPGLPSAAEPLTSARKPGPIGRRRLRPVSAARSTECLMMTATVAGLILVKAVGRGIRMLALRMVTGIEPCTWTTRLSD